MINIQQAFDRFGILTVLIFTYWHTIVTSYFFYLFYYWKTELPTARNASKVKGAKHRNSYVWKQFLCSKNVTLWTAQLLYESFHGKVWLVNHKMFLWIWPLSLHVNSPAILTAQAILAPCNGMVFTHLCVWWKVPEVLEGRSSEWT